MTGTCTAHPERASAARCNGCGRDFCASCLVEFLGELHCGGCRDQRLALLQDDSTFVYGKRRRRTEFFRVVAAGVALLGSFWLVSAAALVGLALFLPAWAIVLLGAAAFVLGILGLVVPNTRMALWGNQQTRDLVAARVSGRGDAEIALGGRFAGLSLHEDRRAFDGETDWDVGFLKLERGRLRYSGDRTWFALQPEQIERLAVVYARGPARLSGARLLVWWRDRRSGRTGVLSLADRDARSTPESSARTRGLALELEAWRILPVPEPAAPWLPPPPPPTGEGKPLADWMV